MTDDKPKLGVDKVAGNPGGEYRTFITSEWYATAKEVTKLPVGERHYQGQKEVEGLGLARLWAGDNVDYVVQEGDFTTKLGNRAPKTGVSQLKSLLALVKQVWLQQKGKDNPKAEVTFTLKDYALWRGFTEAQVRRGGKLLEELRDELHSGEATHYRLHLKRGERGYTMRGTFYTLIEPDSHKGEWRLRFNAYWEDFALNQRAGGFIRLLDRAIKDHETTKRPYIFHLYGAIRGLDRPRTGAPTMYKKISNLLAKDMQLGKRYVSRPQRAYDRLAESINYIGTEYPEELQSVIVSADQRGKSKREFSAKGFNLTYDEFTKLLADLGAPDYRNAFISFRRPPEQRLLAITDTANVNALIDSVMDFADNWRNNHLKDGQPYPLNGYPDRTRSFLFTCIKALGYEAVREAYAMEKGSPKPDALTLLYKTLPEQLKSHKRQQAIRDQTRASLRDVLSKRPKSPTDNLSA